MEDIVSSGRTGRGDEEEVSTSLSVTIWSAWNSTWNGQGANLELMGED